MARHKAPRGRVRRVACLVLLVTAALVIWGAAVTAARRCEAASAGRVIVTACPHP